MQSLYGDYTQRGMLLDNHPPTKTCIEGIRMVSLYCQGSRGIGYVTNNLLSSSFSSPLPFLIPSSSSSLSSWSPSFPPLPPFLLTIPPPPLLLPLPLPTLLLPLLIRLPLLPPPPLPPPPSSSSSWSCLCSVDIYTSQWGCLDRSLMLVNMTNTGHHALPPPTPPPLSVSGR